MKINMMQLNKFLKWSVCGDGYVGFSAHNKNAHYAIERSPEHEDYLKVIANKFIGLQDCNVSITEYIRKDNKKQVLSLRTSSHPIFTRIRNRQYIDNHRVIEPHMLTLLDWEALAFLYMDDGSLGFNNKGSSIVRLSTCAYSYPEQEALRKCLMNLGLVWNINKNGKYYQLNLLKDHQQYFFTNIKSYIVPSYMYKLPESLQKETSRTDGDLV